MRFISKYRSYSFVAIPTRAPEKAIAYGLKAELPIVCDFQHGGLSDWEKKEGLARFEFAGLGHDEKAARRLSFYDTELEAIRLGWDEETKTRVEQRLLGAPGYGVDFFEVERPRLEPPWIRYDEVEDPQEIVTMIRAIGIDPAAVVAYELENRNRQAVLDALEVKEEEPEALINA